MRIRFLSISIFSVASILNVSAASAGPVNGRIVDPDKRPVAHAHVLLVATGTSIRTAETNARGEFTLLVCE